MNNPEVTHAVGGLSERALSIALFVKYVLLTCYGIVAAIVEIPTFVIVGSPLFALVWASATAAFAALAALGVMRSWSTAHHGMERWTTAAFILTFMLYSSALIIRSSLTGEWASSALAFVPAAVCVMPAFRYYSLVGRTASGRKA